MGDQAGISFNHPAVPLPPLPGRTAGNILIATVPVTVTAATGDWGEDDAIFGDKVEKRAIVAGRRQVATRERRESGGISCEGEHSTEVTAELVVWVGIQAMAIKIMTVHMAATANVWCNSYCSEISNINRFAGVGDVRRMQRYSESGEGRLEEVVIRVK